MLHDILYLMQWHSHLNALSVFVFPPDSAVVDIVIQILVLVCSNGFAVGMCRMYIMYGFFFLSRRCVWYVKASCHALVLCWALSHERQRLSGQVGTGPHLFLLTHVYLSSHEQCNDFVMVITQSQRCAEIHPQKSTHMLA